MLSDQSKRRLLALARESIAAQLKNETAPHLDPETLPPELLAPGASFVTLSRGGQLRGCIGSLEARQSLAADVQEHAGDAAFRDFRFPPLADSELPDLEIEISVLSVPEPLRYSNPEQLPGLLHPGVDGVILARGLRRATFLPQVWEKVPDPVAFLDMLCEKMGFDYDLWRREKLEVFVYHVESFLEASLKDG
ncbi:MAG: AmmeMemoRadiSam system protein A [Anaerolineales bacterium]|nr:AmmeMemoRadiSam system protein A [Anaerolineales bacterium]